MSVSRMKITRKDTALIAIVVDLSGSMSTNINYNGMEISKSKALCSIINSFIDELIYRSQRGSEYRDYFELAILGYSGNEVFSMLDYVGRDRLTFKVSDLLRSDVSQGHDVKRRVGIDGKYYTHTTKVNHWITEQNSGNTPTYKALQMVYKIVKDWLKNKNPQTTPTPFIIHVTDGESTDSDEEMLFRIADKIKSLSTAAGGSLFVNVQLTASGYNSVLFPSNIDQIKSRNKTTHQLFKMSSEIPEELSKVLSLFSEKYPLVNEVARAFAYNIGIDDLAKILSIGTSTIR